jgi:hypothetical protein
MTQASDGKPRRGAAREASSDPASWPPGALDDIQKVLERSRERAGAAVRETFDRPQRGMDAAEFVAFWNSCKVKAMSTAGPDGTPHIAPVHAAFTDGHLRTTIYVDAVRRRDLHHNPTVAMTTWGAGGAAAILYGTARELAGSERETRPGASGRSRRTVTLEIEVTRIYAMKPRPQ